MVVHELGALLGHTAGAYELTYMWYFCLQALMMSMASPIIKCDAAFNNNKDGIITVMTGPGFIVGFFMGTSSYYDVAPSLAAMSLRFTALKQVGLVLLLL